MKKRAVHYYDRNASLYDKLLSPVENILSKWRKELLKDVKGKTLEIGIGTGKNLEHYPSDVTITGIDSSKNMLKYARSRAKRYSNIDELLIMNAEELGFPDNTFDTVVASCVFCSIDDPVKAFKEIKRVCKTNGNIFLLEHVRSKRKFLGKIMDILNPISLNLYGDNINRKTSEIILNAGFDPQQIKIVNLWSDIWQIISLRNS